MSTEYTSESETTESRKRAALVLALLIVVAGLVVGVMVTFFNDSGGGNGVAGPTASIAVSPTATAQQSTSSGTNRGASSTTSTTTPPSTPPDTTGSSGPASCPTRAPCIVDGDVGDAISAINAYRTAHGKAAAIGTVSQAAQNCARSNGGACSGSWAQTQVPQNSGQAAVRKILSRGHVLSDYTSFQVGWAYDPAGKQYFFAMIRTG